MQQTKMMDDTLVRVMSWYDNEWGFANRGCARRLARRSPLALEAGGEAFRGLAGRSLAHRAGYAERSAEQPLLRAQRGQPLFVRARNIGTQ